MAGATLALGVKPFREASASCLSECSLLLGTPLTCSEKPQARAEAKADVLVDRPGCGPSCQPRVTKSPRE